MKLLVIIVTYNGIKWIDDCLSSILKSTVKADLFIIDNGSTDGTIEFIQKNYFDANLIISKENLGFGKANNIGLQYALDNKYDYVYLLNQDAWVEPSTFEKMVAVSKIHPEYGILSPLQMNREKNKLDHNFSLSCPAKLLSDSICKINFPDIYDTSFVMAAHWLITKECIATTGGFSPAFPHYGEDNNYIHRANFNGFKVGIVPNAIGVHDREIRKDTLKKKLHLYEMSWFFILSNPLESLNKRVLKLFKSYIYCVYLYKYKSLPLAIDFTKRIFKILKCRRQSKNKGAFLIS